MFVVTEAHVFAIREARRVLRMCAMRSKNPNLKFKWLKVSSLLKSVEDNTMILCDSPSIYSILDRNSELQHPI